MDAILNHYIWLYSKKCLNTGLVDEIYENEPIYDFNKDKAT